VGKESELKNMDREEKKLPSAKDKKYDANVMVSYSFCDVKLFVDSFHIYFYECKSV